MKALTLLKYGWFLINIVGVILLLDTFGIHGLWMYILFVTLITIPRLYTQRQQIIDFVKYVETVFFGKPLDRDQWNRGELNDRKNKRQRVPNKEC